MFAFLCILVLTMFRPFMMTFFLSRLRQTYFENIGRVQGVQTLSVKSNLLILPIQSWSIYDSLGLLTTRQAQFILNHH